MTPTTTTFVLPQRPADANKGTFGRVLVVAGSRGMSGAAALAGLGALRGGAGLVFVAVPQGIANVVAAIEPSYLTIPLAEDADGRIASDARETILAQLKECRVAAIGSGWGRSAGLTALAAEVYCEASCPLVVDADALNALAEYRDTLGDHSGPRVLTPHPGEFARLTGRSIEDIKRERVSLAEEFARGHSVTLVLKGSGTIITDGERTAVNTTGNSGMATGGTGDVLTGLTAALIAQKLEPFDAARLAVHLHGLAGDLAAAELSEPALIASDLPRFLGAAWQQVLSQPGERGTSVRR